MPIYKRDLTYKYKCTRCGDIDNLHISAFNKGEQICKQCYNKRRKKYIKTPKKGNKTGVSGVSWHKRKNQWQCRISINNRRYSLGYFDKLDDAIKRRKEAEVKYLKLDPKVKYAQQS